MKVRSSPREIQDPAEVIPGLFVGSCWAAKDRSILEERSIQLVVNCAVEIECYFEEEEGMRYLKLDLQDDADEEAQLRSNIEKVNAWIETHGNNNNKPVLIHCQAGISRSVSMALGFMMMKKKMSLRESFFLVKEKRPQAGPNVGYWRALMKLEEELTGKATTLDLNTYYAETLGAMGFDQAAAKQLLDDGTPFDLCISRLLQRQ